MLLRVEQQSLANLFHSAHLCGLRFQLIAVSIAYFIQCLFSAHDKQQLLILQELIHPESRKKKKITIQYPMSNEQGLSVE
ncbi:hypothetical protein T4D_408 [Trichinella pseudospiralis]|uniref:Uncharacterized protein n=1 Tax=Trichinella pseudospiralis TaxID=6337 RepID=A0A0V1FGB3_TRIPS|nr:hypothetical protein T4D_408 [Trichinella pseudospiralis]